MRIQPAGWLVIAIAAAGCKQAPPPPAFQAVATVKQLMASILEPAADGYWDAVGSVDDAKGTTYTAPRNDQEWNEVRDYAYIIAESGNLLMMGSRARERADWIAMSEGLIAAGRRALAAAEARDTVAVFNAGAEVYDACTKCHAVYLVPAVQPAATR